MEYIQERITTLHDISRGSRRATVPDHPTDRTCVVVPMTEHTATSPTSADILTTLERVDPSQLIIALRAGREHVATICDWIGAYEINAETIWCDGPRVRRLLGKNDLLTPRGKGRDVWLALGVATAGTEEYIVLHDADTKSYTADHVARLLFGLVCSPPHEFVKGYYARVEGNRLYGRLFRLFYAPLMRALSMHHSSPIVEYLSAFRYALAGEMAMTRSLARQLRVPRSWGLEVGVLGDAFLNAGFDGTAQVDLGVHEHDHRAVDGPEGLETMSTDVSEALFHTLSDGGIEPEYERLRESYRHCGNQLVRQYAADGAFNGWEYDNTAERNQVSTYASAVCSPGVDSRLPAWGEESPIDPVALREAARADREALR